MSSFPEVTHESRKYFLSGVWWLGNMSWYTHCLTFFDISVAMYDVRITHFFEYVFACLVYHSNMYRMVYWL